MVYDDGCLALCRLPSRTRHCQDVRRGLCENIRMCTTQTYRSDAKVKTCFCCVLRRPDDRARAAGLDRRGKSVDRAGWILRWRWRGWGRRRLLILKDDGCALLARKHVDEAVDGRDVKERPAWWHDFRHRVIAGTHVAELSVTR